MAAIPADCVIVTLQADLEDNEHASWGFHMQRVHTAPNTVNWPDDVNEIAEKVRDAWISKVEPATFADSVTLRSVVVGHLSTANKWLDKGMSNFDETNTWSGSASDSMPYEVSMFVRLYGYPHDTLVPDRGRKRGGFFLPPFGKNALSGNDGKISSSVFGAVGTQITDFLNVVQGLEVGVASVGGTDADFMKLVVLSVTGGYATQVVEAGYGNVFDSMRSRRKSQVEQVGYGAIDS